MSKMSKIHSLKQQKKYRNETINILNHMNSKIVTPTLADKSLHKFKSSKPEVQSSRLARPDTAKMYTKYGENYYIGYSKEREKKTEARQGMEKVGSKSLESRQGSVNTHRREIDKTKKNSCARLQTEEVRGNQSESWHIMVENIENSLQKRLKVIQRVFVSKPQDDSQHLYRKNRSYSQLPTQAGSINKKNSKSSWQLLSDLKTKFCQFESLTQKRRNSMLHDQIDTIMTTILSSLHSSFMGIVDSLLRENQQKMYDIEMSVEKIIADHEQQTLKSKKILQKTKQLYTQQIQQMLLKSLYTNDKINAMQERGFINFEMQARKIDGQEPQEEQLDQEVEQPQMEFQYFQSYLQRNFSGIMGKQQNIDRQDYIRKLR